MTTYIVNGIPAKLESDSGEEFTGVINGIPVFYSVPGGTPPTFNPLFLNAAQPTRVIQ